MSRNRQLAISAFLCVAYVASLWLCLLLSGPHSTAPAFWPCNGFLTAAVILLNRRPAMLCVAICVIVSAPLFMTVAPVEFALFRSFFNGVEAVLAGFIGRWALGPRRLLRTGVGFLRLQLLAILPAVAMCWAAWDTAARLVLPSYMVEAWLPAFLPHLMGIAMVAPAMVLMFQPDLPEIKRHSWESGLILGGMVLASILMFGQQTLPITFVIFPFLLLAAFRLGPRGSALGSLFLGVIALPSTVSGGGPFALHPSWDFRERALIYQAICLSSLFAISMGAFLVAEQARLRRLLVRRVAVAREARRRALVASRAKSDFLATMSHEIRTPMNSILGFTQVLLRDPGVTGGAREKIEVIAQAGDSLMMVLNDILDFSKVEAGQVELHVDAVDVRASGAHAIEILQGPARAKGLGLHMETDGAEGLFEMDGQRLRQVLLNLLNNAVKFTNNGEVTLAITCPGDTGMLRFEVRDTGIGVDPEVKDRLFTRFSQADSSTTRDYGGSGLGLAICKGLIEQMGGRIGVDNRPDGGSVFWFELPARRPEPKTALEAAAPAEPMALEGRVLLVDDHPMNRKLGETLLTILGCEVDLATSGEEAVQAASERVYDVILMDVHMPKMDGLAATRAIQALEGPGAKAPIIAMSADVMARTLERCRQAGMVDHIAKPIQLAVMHQVLQRWLVEQKRRSAA